MSQRFQFFELEARSRRKEANNSSAESNVSARRAVFDGVPQPRASV
jgi:hypothetical protein